MITRRSAARRPQLTFTADFHELPQGDLIPGSLILRYDPWRIVPPAELPDFPGSDRAVRAFALLQPSGQYWEGEMRLRPGVQMPIEPDLAGQGPMLSAELPLPAGVDSIELWFSYVNTEGETLWDSASGKNYTLRFPVHDLEIKSARVVPAPGGATDRFAVTVASLPAVDTVTLRWRLTHPTGHPRQEEPLISAGKTIWTTPNDGIPVPCGSTLAFDLVYTVGEDTFTDDNEGTWYLAGTD